MGDGGVQPRFFPLKNKRMSTFLQDCHSISLKSAKSNSLYRPITGVYSSLLDRSHGYFPKNATNKKIKPAKKLANGARSYLRPPSSDALKAIVANPSIPITPQMMRMNGKILSCLLSTGCLAVVRPLRIWTPPV